MPNAALIQQRSFDGGVNDLAPPDTLKDNECLGMVNFLPGASGIPLPVRGGRVKHGVQIAEKAVSGLYHFNRSDGVEFLLAACDTGLYTMTSGVGAANSLIYTFAEARDVVFVTFNDTVYMANGVDRIIGFSGKEVGTDAFTGAGLNDLTPGGTYEGLVPTTYIVEITATGTPDVFKWSDDNGATYTESVNITAGAMTLSDGVTVTFGATTGHTSGNKWTFTAGMAAEVDATAPVANALTTFGGRLWASGNNTSRVYYSGPIDVTSWDGGELDDGGWLYVPQDRDDGEYVVGLATMFNGTVVFKESNTYLWTDGGEAGPGSGSIEILIPGVGLASHETIAYYAGSIYFLGKTTDSSFAVYKLQGSGLDEESTKIPQRLADIIIGSSKRPKAAIYEHHYYLSIDSSDVTGTTRDVTYVLDLRRGAWSEFSGWHVGAFSADNGYLYMGDDDATGLVYRYPSGNTDAGLDDEGADTSNPIEYAFESRPFVSKNAFGDKRWRNAWVDVKGVASGSMRFGVAVDEGERYWSTVDLTTEGVDYWDDGIGYWDDGTLWPTGAGVIHAAMPVPTSIARGREMRLYIEGETSSALEVVRLAVAYRERKTRYGGDD